MAPSAAAACVEATWTYGSPRRWIGLVPADPSYQRRHGRLGNHQGQLVMATSNRVEDGQTWPPWSRPSSHQRLPAASSKRSLRAGHRRLPRRDRGQGGVRHEVPADGGTRHAADAARGPRAFVTVRRRRCASATRMHEAYRNFSRDLSLLREWRPSCGGSPSPLMGEGGAQRRERAGFTFTGNEDRPSPRLTARSRPALGAQPRAPRVAFGSCTSQWLVGACPHPTRGEGEAVVDNYSGGSSVPWSAFASQAPRW